MSHRNKIGLASVLISFVLLYLGLTEPMLNITLTTKVATNLGKIDAEVLNKTRSIIGTILDLHDSGKSFVAFLILLFSVLIPVAKGLLLGIAIFSKKKAELLFSVVKRIGKWSMADVMVVAVFIAYLSTRFDESVVSKNLMVFGMNIKVDIMNQMLSNLMPGFYWFTSYCLVSLVSLEIIKIESEDITA